MPKYMNPTRSDSDAIFIGWQKTSEGNILPMFNVTAADHPFFHSTVTDATLRLDSIWFGRSEQLKAKAFRLAKSML